MGVLPAPGAGATASVAAIPALAAVGPARPGLALVEAHKAV
jgi:hypothetical protein